MLRVTDIHKTFNAGTVNEKQALRGVSLNLEDGEFVTVIGGNGAGKSTFLNAVAGVWPIDSGSIEIDGTDVTGLSEHVRAKYLGRVFQDPMTGTAADMEIEENLALAARRGKSRSPFRWGVTKEEHEKYRELLAQLDLGLENRLVPRKRSRRPVQWHTSAPARPKKRSEPFSPLGITWQLGLICCRI